MDMEFFTARRSRMDAIKAYILAKIDDPNLCLADIAAHQDISSSYVRKLFASGGAKFSTYVLEIRLEKVSRMLTDPDLRLHSISAVALMCGFNDVSYFNRAFRKRYGCTPSDLRSGRHAPHSGPERYGTPETSGQP
jgi:AraC-like DNA-binding protein